MWNKPAFNEAPTYAPMTCTHKDTFSRDESKVALCKGLKDQNICQQDGCVWNPCVMLATAVAPADMKCSMGDPFFDMYVCGFSCPPTGTCKMNALPGTATTAGSYPPTTADTCFQFKTIAACPSTCQWEEYAPIMKPLFTEEFCHPASAPSNGGVKQIPAADWEMCLNMPTGACAAPCVYNNGVDLIPDTDFCAPTFMDKNVSLISECVNADQAKCSGQCTWRKAKVVASNDVFLPGSDVLTSNWCHPPTTADWEKYAPSCYKE
jgi:hypothetical protein